MVTLNPAERVAVADKEDLFLVAGSFEPRSVQVANLLEGGVERAILFNYEDTLDSEAGRLNTREIERYLREKAQRMDLLHCEVKNPFSVIRAFHTYVTQERLAGSVRSVILDATCFTKLHLLLLLKFLSDWLRVKSTRIFYTKPLIYASAFGRQLSYGVSKTIYLPYRGNERKNEKTGLIALLGHEPSRLERVIQELEPDICIALIGDPPYTDDALAFSRRANESLIRRAEYDHHYRLATAPAGDINGCVSVLMEQLRTLHDTGCTDVYLAPLGTKLQALAIDILRRRDDAGRLSIAYAVPQRYDRKSYSQGIGETLVTTFENDLKTTRGITPIPAGGAVVTNEDIVALRDELGI